MSWTDLSEQAKAEYYRRYKDRENIVSLAAEAGVVNPSSFERQLRNWAQRQREESGQTLFLQAKEASLPKVPVQRDVPDYQELFSLIKKQARSLRDLCSIYDRSEDTIRLWINGMREAGYVIEESNSKVSFSKNLRPHTKPPVRTLADEFGQEIVFAACSDGHAGSLAAQPTARRRFLDIAYYEFGARVFFDPGDSTTGVRGYRGQEYDVIPELRQIWDKPALVTQQQIWLYNQYTPEYQDAKFYLLGGNHDYWHISNAGIDPIYAICKQRTDSVYLGYDMADLPLTDKVDIRLWHPGGGGGNTFSGKLQQGLNAAGMEELRRAAEAQENPRLRFLLAGHLHIECKISLGHMVAAHVGCFEGTTNYLKRLGKVPQIGGAIFKVRLTDGGLVQRVMYEFIPFNEIQDDYLNWPVPEITEDEVMHEPEELEVIFKGVHAPGS